MMLPLIRTLEGADSEGCVPSKILTFSMTVTAGGCCAFSGGTEMIATATALVASPRKARRVAARILPPHQRVTAQREVYFAKQGALPSSKTSLSPCEKPGNQRLIPDPAARISGKC